MMAEKLQRISKSLTEWVYDLMIDPMTRPFAYSIAYSAEFSASKSGSQIKIQNNEYRTKSQSVITRCTLPRSPTATNRKSVTCHHPSHSMNITKITGDSGLGRKMNLYIGPHQYPTQYILFKKPKYTK